MKKIISLLLLTSFVVVGGFFLNSESLSKLINERWPPLSTLDQRYSSIEESSAIITGRGFTTDIMVSIADDDLKKQVLPLIEKNRNKIESVKIDGVSHIELNDAKLSFLPQGITVYLNVSFRVDSLDLTIDAVASGDVSVVPKEDGVLLKPALTNITITPTNPVKARWAIFGNPRDELITYVATILESLLENINGAAFRDGFHIPFDLSVAKKFSPADIKTKDNIDISGEDIPLQISLPTLAVYINKSSLYILASTSSNPRSTNITDKGVITDEIFLPAFQRLESAVESSLQKCFGDGFSIKNKESTVILRKGMLSTVINNALNSINISLSVKDFITVPKPGAPEGSNRFSQDIALHDKQTLPSCKGLYRDFKGDACDNPCSYSHITCDKKCNLSDCNNGCSLSSCDYGCKWSRPDRCAREAACKAARETKRAACDAAKAACKVARETKRAACDAKNAACKVDRETRRENCKRKNTKCKVKREADRIAHQAENEVRVAKCKGKRAALKLVDGLVKLGEITGEYWVNNSRLQSVISGINVTDDLSEIRVNSSINSSLNARLRVWVNPEGLGHIACIFSFRKTIETHAAYANDNLVLKGSMSHNYDNEGNLVLIGRTVPLSLTAKLSPSPYSQLIRDPEFLVNCTFLNMAIPTVAGVQLFKEGSLSDEFSTLFGRAKIDIDQQEFPLIIRPIVIGSNDNAIKLSPKWGGKLVRFDIQNEK